MSLLSCPGLMTWKEGDGRLLDGVTGVVMLGGKLGEGGAVAVAPPLLFPTPFLSAATSNSLTGSCIQTCHVDEEANQQETARST